jgi:glycosyltransferase involved in cell wall biosynthesis
MQSGLVSVIIPVYNNAVYIGRLLDSVLMQTYTHFEIIVVDDGSTDDLKAAIEPYRIQYVYQSNQGAAAARNSGIRQAQGEFITFPDADDFLLSSDVFADQIAMLQANSGVDAIHTGWAISTEQGDIVEEVKPWQFAPELNLQAWLWQTPILLPAMMFRRCAIEKAGLFDVALRQAEDMDFVVRLTLAGCKFQWLHHVTYAYRQHAHSTTHARAHEQIEATLDFWRRVADSRSLVRKEQQSSFLYYKLLWAGRSCVEYEHWEGIEAYLRDSVRYAPHPPAKVLIDWTAHLFYPHYTEQAASQIIARLKQAAGLGQVYEPLRGFVFETESLLRWWLFTWGRHYHKFVQRGEPSEGWSGEALRAYPSQEAKRLVWISLQLMPDLLYIRNPIEFAASICHTALDRQSVGGIMLIVLARALYARHLRILAAVGNALIRQRPTRQDFIRVLQLQIAYLRARFARKSLHTEDNMPELY